MQEKSEIQEKPTEWTVVDNATNNFYGDDYHGSLSNESMAERCAVRLMERLEKVVFDLKIWILSDHRVSKTLFRKDVATLSMRE